MKLFFKAIDQHIQFSQPVILVFQHGDEILWQPRFHPLQRHRELPVHRCPAFVDGFAELQQRTVQGINLRCSELHQLSARAV